MLNSTGVLIDLMFALPGKMVFCSSGGGKASAMKFWVAILPGLLLTIGLSSDPRAVALAEPPFCAYMTQTGHNVHGAFLVFYRGHK